MCLGVCQRETLWSWETADTISEQMPSMVGSVQVPAIVFRVFWQLHRLTDKTVLSIF